MSWTITSHTVVGSTSTMTATYPQLAAPGVTGDLTVLGYGIGTVEYTVANKDTNVIVRLEGSNDDANYFVIQPDTTQTANGSFSFNWQISTKFVRFNWVSEAGLPNATIDLTVTATSGNNSGGNPGGSNNAVQYNNNGSFAGLEIGAATQVLTVSAGATGIEWAAGGGGGGGVTLVGAVDNTITTVTGADAIQGEANLKFDGATLTILGNTNCSGIYGTSGLPLNVRVGHEAGNASTADNRKSVFVGYQAGKLCEGVDNTLIGYQAGGIGVTNTDNTCVGYAAGLDIDNGAVQNTFIGASAGRNITTGQCNVCVGRNAGLMSHAALTGHDNVFIGDNSGVNFSDASSSNICVGHGAGPTADTSDELNKLYIGSDPGAGTPIIYGDYSEGVLAVCIGDTNLTNVPLQGLRAPGGLVTGGSTTIFWEDGHLGNSTQLVFTPSDFVGNVGNSIMSLDSSNLVPGRNSRWYGNITADANGTIIAQKVVPKGFQITAKDTITIFTPAGAVAGTTCRVSGQAINIGGTTALFPLLNSTAFDTNVEVPFTLGTLVGDGKNIVNILWIAGSALTTANSPSGAIITMSRITS